MDGKKLTEFKKLTRESRRGRKAANGNKKKYKIETEIT
jgi:hypothetical protein